MKSVVLGAGSWGTALAHVLATNGHETVLWGRNASVAKDVNESHVNTRYLPNATLHQGVVASSEISSALCGAGLVVLAVPSQALCDVLESVADWIPGDATIVHAIKGFIRPGNRRISEEIELKIPEVDRRLVVISGPSHAEEVVRGLPTTVVVASKRKKAAEFVQDAFMNQVFRVYTQSDVVGVELGGTLKNIIALGVGIADGLGLGDNTKAALITRGLAEITRLGISLGASPLTFSGLAGIGDLIVTCTSLHSRNFRTGRLLASGCTLEDALHQIGMAVEGVGTTFTAAEIANSHQIDMPITTALRAVFSGELKPNEAVLELMQREKNHEMEDVGQAVLHQQWLID